MTSTFSIEDSVVAAIRRIIRAVDLQSRRLAEQSGLTGPQLTTLREAARLGDVSSGVLAKAVHLSQPTVSGILDRLEKRGLIARSRKDTDRRNVIVSITDRGLAVRESAPSLLQDRFQRELRRLEEWERTSLLAALQHIATMMDAEGIEASPVLVTGPMTAGTEEVDRDDAAPAASVAPAAAGETTHAGEPSGASISPRKERT